MELEQLLIIGVLLVLLAEVTYLVAKLPRQISSKKRLIFVDTSVLIDGRIMAIAKSGFIGDTLAIPRSVIGELQFLADNADAEKRTRARHGLDIAKELQAIEHLDVQLFQDGSKAEEGVDERLLNLAKKYSGAICTIDYNLNKVAAVEGIVVCNVNDLAKELRMAYLPGEKIMLEMVQKGQDNHQGVGYLPDGTMVVVEQASSHVGQTIEIEFIRSLQTAAGKMMFAKRTESAKSKQNLPKQGASVKVAGSKPTGTKPVRQQNVASTSPANNPTNTTTASKTRNTSNSKPRNQKRRQNDAESNLLDLVEKQNK